MSISYKKYARQIPDWKKYRKQALFEELGNMLIGFGFIPVVEVLILAFWIFNVGTFYFRCYL